MRVPDCDRGEPILEMRRLGNADGPTMYAWTQLDAVCRYQRWGPYTRSETEAVVTAIISDETRHTWIAIVPDGLDPGGDVTKTEFGAGQAVGYIELHIFDAESRCAEIGYGLHPDAWGRGLATRMAVAAVSYAFDALRLHRVEATCDARNVASIAVLSKVGMRHEGRLRENVRLRDGWRDSEVFGVLAHEWVSSADCIVLR